MKVIIDIRRKNLEKYPYKTTKLGKLYFPRVDPDQEETKIWESFGIDDRFFGGNINKIAEVKDKPFFILINKNDDTLGILHKFSDLNKYTLEELQDVGGIFDIQSTNKKNLLEAIMKLEN